MKICILSCFEDSMEKAMGASVRISSLAKGLSDAQNEIKVILPRSKSSLKVVDGIAVYGIKGLCPNSALQGLKKVVDVVRPTALYFYDLLFLLRASRIIRTCEIIQIEQPASGVLLIPFAKNILKKRVVIDCHDVFQAQRVKHTSPYRRVIETLLEKFAYKKADLLLVVSDIEKNRLKSSGFQKCPIVVIPNGVDTVQIQKTSRTTWDPKKYNLEGYRLVVFIGNLSYIPNREAAQLLSSSIAPKVEEKIANVKFLIVGKLEQKLEMPGLTFTGYVDNISEVLQASDVAVAPLFQGTGTRLKILEYFSNSLPVVSTSIGAEGLDVKNGVNIFIENNLDQFANRIIELLKNKELSVSLGSSARILAQTTYDWKHITKRLNENLESLLHQKLVND
jgi:glycosyltransferase involved in cell wall biosynthesis